MLTIRRRDLLYLALAFGSFLLLYLGRDVLLPFFLAAAFAYILNPFVTFLSHKIKLPRTLAIFLIYFLLIGGLGFIIITVWSRFAEESFQLTRETGNFYKAANDQINNLPIWLQSITKGSLDSAKNSSFLSSKKIVQIIPGAVNHILTALIFLIATFYFLKDGQKFLANFFNLFPGNLKFEAEVIVRKVNQVLGNYLRAQLLLIIIMSSLTFVILTILGVRYSLSIAVFTGIAETVPFVGPIVAAFLACVIAYTDSLSRFGLDPTTEVIAVAGAYTILRQLEDYFIIPQVLGRMTKLHPLVVLFAALFGGHLFGIIGFVAAVPIVASLRVVLEHTLNLVGHEKALQD